MVTPTPPEDLCRDLIDRMIQVKRQGHGAENGQQFLEPRLYLPESV